MEKYIQKINIQSYQTDQYGKSSVCSLLHLMLEAAWAHAKVMDWGYDQLQSQHMFWVLSRMYVQVENYPSWQDNITLNTWSSGTDGIYAYREFILVNEQGEKLLTANSAWLILDVTTKKIMLLRDYMETFPRFNGNSVCREPQRLRAHKHHSELSFSPVLFSDLDINKHFNSVKSMERVLDHFGIDFLNRNEPESIEINYLKEGLAGDRLAVSTEKSTENSYFSSIIRESDLAALSTMKTTWRKRND